MMWRYWRAPSVRTSRPKLRRKRRRCRRRMSTMAVCWMFNRVRVAAVRGRSGRRMCRSTVTASYRAVVRMIVWIMLRAVWIICYCVYLPMILQAHRRQPMRKYRSTPRRWSLWRLRRQQVHRQSRQQQRQQQPQPYQHP